jgi:hypothetical protein
MKWMKQANRNIKMLLFFLLVKNRSNMQLTSTMALPRHSYPVLLPFDSASASLQFHRCSTGMTTNPAPGKGMCRRRSVHHVLSAPFVAQVVEAKVHVDVSGKGGEENKRG